MNILNMLFDFDSLKIGPHHRFVGAKLFLELLNEHKSCFAYVTDVSTLNEIELAAKSIRDLDLLNEMLGMLFRSKFRNDISYEIDR